MAKRKRRERRLGRPIQVGDVLMVRALMDIYHVAEITDKHVILENVYDESDRLNVRRYTANQPSFWGVFKFLWTVEEVARETT